MYNNILSALDVKHENMANWGGEFKILKKKEPNHFVYSYDYMNPSRVLVTESCIFSDFEMFWSIICLNF